MLETSATRRSTRRATEGHTGTRTSLHSAPPSGCLPEPQTAVRLSTDHTAGPAKPQPIPGSQRAASRPPTQTCPGSTRQPQCSPQPFTQTRALHAGNRAGFRSIRTAHRSSLSPLGSPPAAGSTTSPSRSCSLAFQQSPNAVPAVGRSPAAPGRTGPGCRPRPSSIPARRPPCPR